MKAKILHLLAASAIMGAAAQLNAADAAPKNAAPEAKQRVRDFLEGRAAKVQKA